MQQTNVMNVHLRVYINLKIIKMKKIQLFVFFIVLTTISFGQIGGISASKLIVYNAQVVPEKIIEFEPSFALAHSKNFYTVDGTVLNYPEFWENGFGFRFTYGLFRNLETGFSVNSDASDVRYGFKYNFLNYNKLSVAALAGTNLILTNNWFLEYVFGSAITLNFSDNFSSDFSVQYLINNKMPVNTMFYAFETGYYLGDIQLILGLNYKTGVSKYFIDDNLFITPGFTLETGKNFILVVAAPFSVYGKADYKTAGFNVALTISIN